MRPRVRIPLTPPIIMQICSICGLNKSLDNFTKSRRKWCRQCISKYDKDRYKQRTKEERARCLEKRNKNKENNKTKLLEFLKNKKCEDCGEKDVVVLEFDHIDPKTKKFSIGDAISSGKTWKRIKIEIDKCRILCANCHRRRTSKQQQWFKSN